MKGKYVYIQLYPKDLLADEKLAKCDKAGAWGAYLALLNIMAMEPVRGCIRLRDWDTRPDNKRYSLVANFERANSLKARASAFAKVVSQRTPLRGKALVEGIEQLIQFGVVVIHGDALIQPRMFREGRGQLEGYKPEAEQDGTEALRVTDAPADPAPSEPQKPHDSNTEKARVRDSRKHAYVRFENESENNNIDNNGNTGGVGERENGGETKTPDNSPAKRKRAAPFTPPTQEEVTAYCQEKGYTFDPVQFWNHYEANGWVQGRGKPVRKWQACCVTWQQREQSGEFRSAAPPRRRAAVPADNSNTYKDKW